MDTKNRSLSQLPAIEINYWHFSPHKRFTEFKLQTHLNISCSLITGYSFNGASNMSGGFNGLHARLNKTWTKCVWLPNFVKVRGYSHNCSLFGCGDFNIQECWTAARVKGRWCGQCINLTPLSITKQTTTGCHHQWPCGQKLRNQLEPGYETSFCCCCFKIFFMGFSTFIVW